MRSEENMKDDLKSPLPPLPPLPPLEQPSKPNPTPAPAWVALLSVWIALLTLFASIVLPFLPGSRNPRAELEHVQPYSPADRFLPVPIYGTVIGLFLAIVVLWQMRQEPRPLPEALVNQRLQAWVAIALALLAAAAIYIHVALRGPGAHV
jgi:hypothetical protein